MGETWSPYCRSASEEEDAGRVPSHLVRISHARILSASCAHNASGPHPSGPHLGCADAVHIGPYPARIRPPDSIPHPISLQPANGDTWVAAMRQLKSSGLDVEATLYDALPSEEEVLAALKHTAGQPAKVWFVCGIGVVGFRGSRRNLPPIP